MMRLPCSFRLLWEAGGGIKPTRQSMAVWQTSCAPILRRSTSASMGPSTALMRQLACHLCMILTPSNIAAPQLEFPKH